MRRSTGLPAKAPPRRGARTWPAPLVAALFLFAQPPGASAQIAPAPRTARTIQQPPPRLWSPMDWAPLATDYRLFHPQVFALSAAGPSQNTAPPTAAICLGEFDLNPGADLIALRGDGLLAVSRNWRANLGEPIPPETLQIQLPPFRWDPLSSGEEVLMKPLHLTPGSSAADLVILTQMPPQLIVVRHPLSPARRIYHHPIPQILPSALKIQDLDFDGREEILFLQNERVPFAHIWSRTLYFAAYDPGRDLFRGGSYAFAFAPAPVVDFAIDDFDANGLLDVVYADLHGFHIYVQFPGRGLVLAHHSPYLRQDVRGLQVGDLDGDGKKDFVILHDRGVEAFFQASRGATTADLSFDTSFASWLAPSSATPPRITDLRLVDIDQDGYCDFLLSLDARMCFVVWKMKAGGRLSSPASGRGIYGYLDPTLLPFTPPALLGTNPNGRIELADTDLDGDLDAYLLNPEQGLLFRMTNRNRHEAPHIRNVIITPDPSTAAAGSMLTVTVEYTPHRNFRQQVFLMSFSLYEQSGHRLNPTPAFTAITPVILPANPPASFFESFQIPRWRWARSSNLALLVSHFHYGTARSAATVLIEGGRPTGIPQSGNGTTSCPTQVERIVWETNYKPTCRTTSSGGGGSSSDKP